MGQSRTPHSTDLPKTLRFALIIASGTISQQMEKGLPYSDVSGDTAADLITHANHRLVERTYLPNSAEAIGGKVQVLAASGHVDIVLISGGTGLSRRDVTVEALKPLFAKELPGFGEIFRQLSFGAIGTAAMASRATAGTVGECLVFLLPGSPDAVKLALEKIILPESPHLIKMIRD